MVMKNYVQLPLYGEGIGIKYGLTLAVEDLYRNSVARYGRHTSVIMRKPTICGNREADQRLCFESDSCDSTIILLSKTKISSL